MLRLLYRYYYCLLCIVVSDNLHSKMLEIVTVVLLVELYFCDSDVYVH